MTRTSIRVQIAQDRIIETVPPEARTGERDPVPEAARKKVRFAQRVEEQAPEGTVAANSRSTSSNSNSSSSSIPAAVQPRLRHQCRLTRAQKDRKLSVVLKW